MSEYESNGNKVQREDLIQDIVRVSNVVNRSPSVDEYKEHGEYSINSVIRKFGSWTNGKEKAGLEKQSKIPRKEIINDIVRVSNIVNKSPSVDEYKEHGEYSVSSVTNKFGSWSDAKEEAGLERVSKITHEEIINDIKEVAKELGKTPSAREYQDLGEFSRPTISDRFGSWSNAVEESGLEGRGKQVTDRQYLKDVNRLADELGKVPNTTDYIKYGEYSSRSILDRFETWSKVLERASNHD